MEMFVEHMTYTAKVRGSLCYYQEKFYHYVTNDYNLSAAQ